MATNLATLGIKVDPSKAISGANKARKAILRIGKAAKKIGGAIGKIGKAFGKFGAIGLGVIATIGFFVKKSLNATDAMAKMSRAIGVSIESLQKLRHAGNLAGMGATAVDKAVQKLAVNMADIAKGTGEAKDIFDKYGISATGVDGKLRSVEDVMLDIADVTSTMTNRTEKAELAYRLFGARGGLMINMLEQGSDAMREQWEEAEKLGLVMSEKTAKGVEEANDAMARLSGFLTSSFRRAIAELAPAITEITNGIRSWVEAKVTQEGGIGKIATQMAASILMASHSILTSFESITNGMIEMAKKVRDLNPFADTAMDMQKDIAETTIAIDNLKSKMSKPMTLLGIEIERSQEVKDFNDSMLKSLEDKKKALQEQLMLVKQLEGIEHVSFQKGKSAIALMTANLFKAADAAKELNKDLGGGDEEIKQKTLTWLDRIKEGWEGVQGGMLQYVKDAKDAEKQSDALGKIGMKVAQSMEDAFVNMAMGVKTSFKDMADAIISDIIRIAVRQRIVAPLLNILGGSGLFGAVGTQSGVGVPIIEKSFAGGGFTGTGSRSGGIDGQGGFPAILHPNETVTDHTRGGGNVTTAEINFNVQAIDSSSFNNYLIGNRGTIEGIINSSLTSNGSVRRTIKQVV